MSLLFVLVACAYGHGLIKSRMSIQGRSFCMRSPNDDEGANIQIVTCDEKDVRQWWYRKAVINRIYEITSYSSGKVLTLRWNKDANGNVLQQRSSYKSQWQWDNSGRMSLAGGSGKYSVACDRHPKLYRNHHGKHQQWVYLPNETDEFVNMANSRMEEMARLKQHEHSDSKGKAAAAVEAMRKAKAASEAAMKRKMEAAEAARKRIEAMRKFRGRRRLMSKTTRTE